MRKKIQDIEIKQPIVDNSLEGTTRLEAFSDGVIAIVITLLIFEIKVPEKKNFLMQGSLVP